MISVIVIFYLNMNIATNLQLIFKTIFLMIVNHSNGFKI